MLIIVNPASNGGNGAARWARLEPELRSRGVAFEARATASAAEVPELVLSARARGHEAVIAAGGDGTVNAVLNALMDPARDLPRCDVALGAIGLGSSNDFHKPFRPGSMVAGVPVRIDVARATAIDVGKAALAGPAGGPPAIRYFLLNASMGLVAEGNAFFNAPDAVLARLKRLHVEAAIIYAAAVNIARFTVRRASIALDGGAPLVLPVSCIGILKRVHFAGGMRYDTPVEPADGLFDVNVWLRMGRLDIVRAIAALYRGRFRGLPRTRCFRAARVAVTPERPAHFELDGEVRLASRGEFAVLPRALRVCG